MGDFPQRLIFRIIALQFFLGEEKQCLFFDWESQEVYERAQQAEITGFAWECLRRNLHYQRERDEIAGPDHGVTADFRRRWGVCFRG